MGVRIPLGEIYLFCTDIRIHVVIHLHCTEIAVTEPIFGATIINPQQLYYKVEKILGTYSYLERTLIGCVLFDLSFGLCLVKICLQLLSSPLSMYFRSSCHVCLNCDEACNHITIV